MGALLGLTFGLGVVLVVSVWVFPAPPKSRRAVGASLLAEAGLGDQPAGAVFAACLTTGLVTGAVVWAVSQAITIGAAFAVIGGYLPVAMLRSRSRRRRDEMRALWPDVIDSIASAVRAGMGLPDAVSALAHRGPDGMRPDFAAFEADYRVSGSFNRSLDALKYRLADPTGDRVVETLRMARDVGGHDLGRTLRTLSGFLREDHRARAELETRQGWVVNAARVAVAGPWVLLLLLSLRSSTVQTYQSTAGAVVLAVGAAATVAAYRVMVRLGRLPAEPRVLR
jgi:tight adherence protein B